MDKLFALGHRRFVGKDTAARFLINHIRLEHRGRQVQKISFATKLKSTVYDLFRRYGVRPPDFYEQNPAEKEAIIPGLNMSMRDIWIKFGNELRAYMPDIWIDHAFEAATAQIVLVPDLRYLDEAAAIQARGGVLIRLDRACVEKHDDVADSQLEAFEGWDYIIKNDGDLSDLQKAITYIVDMELAK